MLAVRSPLGVLLKTIPDDHLLKKRVKGSPGSLQVCPPMSAALFQACLCLCKLQMKRNLIPAPECSNRHAHQVCHMVSQGLTRKVDCRRRHRTGTGNACA